MVSRPLFAAARAPCAIRLSKTIDVFEAHPQPTFLMARGCTFILATIVGEIFNA